jgi:hypothetical protein
MRDSLKMLAETRCIVSALFLASVLGVKASGQCEAEPAVLCQEGVVPEPVFLNYGEHTEGGMIDDIVDSDLFTFVGSEDECVSISVSETTTTAIELVLEVFDPSGNQIIPIPSPGGNILRDVILPETGTYLISISENGLDEIGGYQLQLERVAPPVPPPALNYDEPVHCALEHITDFDFFVFEANAGIPIRVTVSETTTTAIELSLIVYDPSKNIIVDRAPGGNILENITPPATGSYLVCLQDVGKDETGGYALEIQCLSGNPGDCPGPSSIVFCDLTMSQSCYVNGEVVTAETFRFGNFSDSDVMIDYRLWAVMPGVGPINLDSKNSVVLKAGTSTEAGPMEIGVVTEGLPRGSYQLACRLLDAETGRTIALDLNPFCIQ